MRRVAVIGTAGRSSPHMTRSLWDAMRDDFKLRINPDDVLVSGGAAWADHLAVDAFLRSRCAGLELYLPAPMTAFSLWPRFMGPRGSSGAAANFYHKKFSVACGMESLEQIARAAQRGAVVSFEPVKSGYVGMFQRNTKVAGRCQHCIAYTFGDRDQPDDGGTLDTWKQVSGTREHVDLNTLRRRQD